MSFLKITDPRKREATIKDFIETRKRIKDNFLAERVGEIGVQRELGKFFKPVTETQKTTAKDIVDAQKKTTEEITKELAPVKEGIEELPLKILNKVFPSIEFKERVVAKFGPLPVNALLMAYTEKNNDTTYGLHAKNNKISIGDTQVTIEDNNIIVDGKEYTGTPGLWHLLTNKEPNDKIYTNENIAEHAIILYKTNALYRGNDPIKNPNIAKSYQGPKWKKVVKFIWENRKDFEGEGLKKTTILPSDPNALLERLDLLIASQDAGHTGVRNELVSICDELKRQGAINADTYKKLNSIIKK